MDRQRVLRKLVVAVAAAFCTGGPALAADEVEPNDSIASANALQFESPASMNGVIGTNFGSAVLDVDFYSFAAAKGDVVTIDIDHGIGGTRDVDTNISLYGPDNRLLVDKDDLLPEEPLDTDSSDRMDPRITDFTIPATGTYTVGVSSFPVFLNADGTYPTGQVGENGDYTLVVSIVRANPVPPPPPASEPPAALQIGIDIKPSVVRQSKGHIAVTVVGSSAVKPSQVEVNSLTFGASGDEARPEKCDKNRGRRLVCHFKTELTGLTTANDSAMLKGKTKSGASFYGSGKVKVVERKRGDDDDDD